MSESDRELLELAARAAGYKVFGDQHPRDGLNILIGDRVHVWRPREDDGDALRLAVALQISINYRFGTTVTANAAHWCWNPTVQSGAGANSTRLAIVREAAEIGRRMA